MSNEANLQNSSPTLDESDILPLSHEDREADASNPMNIVMGFVGALLSLEAIEVVGGLGGGLDMSAITPQTPLPTFDNSFDPNMMASMGAPTTPSGMV